MADPTGVDPGDGPGGGQEFERLALPYRRELLAHCYRMLGSADEAEDLVQETYLRAWRSYDGFEGRSSLRTWLYRIATSACLTALEGRSRRPMPAGLAGPTDDPGHPLAAPRPDIPWLQPLPDAALEPGPDDPADTVSLRAGLRLALVAAMQQLPPRQRAVLILRDVLAWRAAEVAEALDMTTAAVNSALQRARAQLTAAGLTEDDVSESLDPGDRALVDRYVAAFEAADVTGLLAILRDDVTLQMPPHPTWFAGRDAVARFVVDACGRIHAGGFTLPVTANGQAGIALYHADGRGGHVAHSIQLFTVRDGAIASIDAFVDPAYFAGFGLPAAMGSSELARARG
jgi:RNA polymerase sigma-70 factor (ECF subfamily)